MLNLGIYLMIWVISFSSSWFILLKISLLYVSLISTSYYFSSSVVQLPQNIILSIYFYLYINADIFYLNKHPYRNLLSLLIFLEKIKKVAG